ncbi:hypothetical protein [Oceanobacillus rekensis]|uniref:hypothetical protein n=1 Tax=Oceanobacillus rekensis TaxID=937927 RepID=UPI001FE3E40B|nr:hypothetical protein [Oceanobacillus rekensis]
MYEAYYQGNLKAGGIHMEQQALSIEEFNDKLKSWTGKNIKITKKELNDLDETEIELQYVSYSNNTQSIDDYVSEHSLILSGEGEIENAENQMEPLPAPRYEIPLDDTSNYYFDGKLFNLKTDRATYTIEEK